VLKVRKHQFFERTQYAALVNRFERPRHAFSLMDRTAQVPRHRRPDLAAREDGGLTF
jgi:hypothetical protein